MVMAAACSFAAQPVELRAEFRDGLTREKIIDAEVRIFDKDSVLWRTVRITGDEIWRSLTVDSVPREGGYVNVTKEGYFPLNLKYRAAGPREDYVNIATGVILMHRDPTYRPPKTLDEVEVVASVVKMVVRGDTIVYNADAFQLAEGSMLDDLVRQMPGVSIKGGNITVNGKHVSQLLLNGDEIFKGTDNSMLLQNLAAMTVKNVKVYHRQDRGSFQRDVPPEDLPLVMDVVLKKEYQIGFMGNVEGGYGTYDRFAGRLFGLLFTPDSRLTVVGNYNNTNDDRRPGDDNSWNPNWQAAGRSTIATGGIDYLLRDSRRRWSLISNVIAEQRDADLQTSSLAEKYVPGGSIFDRSTSSSRNKPFTVSTEHYIGFKNDVFSIVAVPSFKYTRQRSRSRSASEMTDAEGLLNTSDMFANSLTHIYNGGMILSYDMPVPHTPDIFEVRAEVNYNDKRTEEISGQEIRYRLAPDADTRLNPFQRLPEQTWTAKAKAMYHAQFNFDGLRTDARLTYQYDYRRCRSDREYYSRMWGDGTDSEPAQDRLPSELEAAWRLDAGNTFYSTLETQSHTIAPEWWQSLARGRDGWKKRLFIRPTMVYVSSRLDYLRNGLTHRPRRSAFLFTPNVFLSIWGRLSAGYELQQELPDLMQTVDIEDAANPLFIHKGNPDLANRMTHRFTLSSTNNQFGRRVRLDYSAEAKIFRNSVAQSVAYDMTTGVTTYRPVNINGNWNLSADMRWQFKPGRDDMWLIESTTDYRFDHSVDLINNARSLVWNHKLSEKLSVDCRATSWLTVNAFGNAEWRRATSRMAGFVPVNAVDFDYGLTLRSAKLPYDWSVSTDIAMHSRRGYADSRLNDNHLVWNARVSKSILKGKLTFILDGFDILGQLSNVTYEINAQGRTESRYNTLPRYALFHVIYRLNIQPQKH